MAGSWKLDLALAFGSEAARYLPRAGAGIMAKGTGFVMRILFFTHYYPPEVNAPASRTVRTLPAPGPQAGAEVTVVTCAPNHPHGKIYPGYRNSLWRTETRDGVKVVRLWTWLAANEGFLAAHSQLRQLHGRRDPRAAVPAEGGYRGDDLAAVLLRAGRPVREAGQARALGAGDPRPVAGEHRRGRGDEEGQGDPLPGMARRLRLPAGRRDRLADARLRAAYRRPLRRSGTRSPSS